MRSTQFENDDNIIIRAPKPTCEAVNPANGVRCGLPAEPKHDIHQNGTMTRPWSESHVEGRTGTND